MEGRAVGAVVRGSRAAVRGSRGAWLGTTIWIVVVLGHILGGIGLGHDDHAVMDYLVSNNVRKGKLMVGLVQYLGSMALWDLFFGGRLGRVKEGSFLLGVVAVELGGGD